MKKVLFVASVTKHINAFHIPYLKVFKESGYEVHVASNGEEKIEYCDKHYNLPFERSPLKVQNYKVYKELKKIIEENKYEIVHCHTPTASVLTRLAARKERKRGTKVFYTAHGFHFYKGAPLLNWIIYYPIEKLMARYTDCLITINKEDYEIAKKKFKKAKEIKYVHGVGLDTTKFDINISNEEIEKLKKDLDINKEAVILTYVAELNKNKNQLLLIKTIEKLIKQDKKNYVLLLVGDGALKQKYQEYISEKNLGNNIKLLGKRNDIPQILKLTDIYVASSLREGLPVNIMEAMYMGLPIIATDNRGHREIIKNQPNGYIIHNKEELIQHINNLKNDKLLNNSELNIETVEKYLIPNVEKEMKRIYKVKG